MWRRGNSGAHAGASINMALCCVSMTRPAPTDTGRKEGRKEGEQRRKRRRRKKTLQACNVCGRRCARNLCLFYIQPLMHSGLRVMPTHLCCLLQPPTPPFTAICSMRAPRYAPPPHRPTRTCTPPRFRSGGLQRRRLCHFAGYFRHPARFLPTHTHPQLSTLPVVTGNAADAVRLRKPFAATFNTFVGCPCHGSFYRCHLTTAAGTLRDTALTSLCAAPARGSASSTPVTCAFNHTSRIPALTRCALVCCSTS